MGLTKQYLAYKPCGSFNIICSSRPNVNFLIYNKIEGRYVVVGGAENALVWDLRLGEKILQFNREKSEVSCLRASPDRIHVAVGYVDGVVEVFDIETQQSVFSLAAHSSAVSILRYDEIGIRLLSGGLDTELVVSDVVALVGKQRLIGHNAAVTDGYFFERFDLNNIVVSSSKDTQIKFWNLETQTCFKTIVDNRTEVWSLAFVADFLVSGTAESTLNVYRISKQDKNEQSISTATTLIEGLSLDEEETISPINVVNCGVIQRAGKGRTVNLIADKTQRVLITHGTNDLLEIFYICTEEEIKANVAKRLKKSQASEKGSTAPCLLDEIKRLPTVKVGNKIKSIDALIGLKDELRIVVTSANNSIQTYSLDISKKNSTPKQLRSITQCGHQSEVRTVAFSSDSLAIVSGSANSMKVWNQESFQCLRTVPTSYILSSCFVPGDRHVLLGMKTGHLLIVDLGTGEILEEIAAHSNELWSICLLADLQGCATGSSDTTVKIWSFELIEDPKCENNVAKPKILSLLHKRTLKLEEAVLCVRISPNNKFIAAGLLDSTVKIFFLDSFKFFLSLYGHKLPVLCMDISYDSTLIATGSADRNVKIWGLDFGDCHRSLIAHDDSVMGLQFIPKTHMFFTCGKDGKIKQWDGDSFDKIITINGHVGECYSLAVSPNGKYIVSCGSDRTLRLYEQTDEPIVLSDVQEEEREEMENQTLATGEDNTIPTLPGLKLPSRKTVGSEKAAESILECLDICKSFEEDPDEKPDLHPLMIAHNVTNSDDFFIAVLERIRASDMEECLILLPFSYVCKILEMIPRLTTNRNDKAETILKVVLFLFKIHHKPIVSNQTLLPIISKMIANLQDLVVGLRDMIGINLCSLQLLQRDLEEKEGIELFRDITKAKKQREKKIKKRQLTKRLHIQMS